MLATQLDIWVDTFNLAKLLALYQSGKKPRGDKGAFMPKHARYGIMNECVNVTISCLDVIYMANKNKNSRALYYETFLERLQGVHSRIRLMSEVGWLSVRQTTNIMTLMDKVGKQATALRNASRSPTAN